MVDFDNVLCDAYDLHDKDLMRLRDEINREIQKREKKRELEAAEKVTKAIQEYIEAGYDLNIFGDVTYYADGYEHTASLIGRVENVVNNNGDITLNFGESYIET